MKPLIIVVLATLASGDALAEPNEVVAYIIASLQEHESVCPGKARTEAFKTARARMLDIYLKNYDAEMVDKARKEIHDEISLNGRRDWCRLWNKAITNYQLNYQLRGSGS